MKYRIEPGLLSSQDLISDKNGTTILFQRSNSWSPPFPDVYRLLLKEDGMLHSHKHDPVPF